jgi:outer membrane receptor protein involved in Fe transport
LAISTILAAGPLRVAAQDEPLIEEIIVTATRRAESVQDIPLNIAAFDGDLLEDREITDLAELGRNVPGLYVVDQGKRNANHIVVRGLNLDTIRGPEALGNNGGETVATYVGEIPLYVDFDLTDMERVEVLLGPQGTLYGAGTLGGAIRYIPERPDFAAPSLTFRATSFDLAESDGYGLRGGMTANFPLGDNLALRATVSHYDDPGFIDAPFLVREPGVSDPEPDFTDPAAVAANLYGMEDSNDEQTLSGRVALRWQPTDAIDANLTYFYQKREVGGRSDNHSVAFQTDLYTSATRYPEPNERENRLAALEVVADLGFAELTSATGYSRYEDLGQRDQTDLLITLEYAYEAFPSFSAFTRDDQTDDTFTQELRLVSQTDGPLSWIAGLFYLDQSSVQNSREFTPHYDEYLGGVLRPDSLEYISALNSDLTDRGVLGEVV